MEFFVRLNASIHFTMGAMGVIIKITHNSLLTEPLHITNEKPL
jgi:hypothetical protein